MPGAIMVDINGLRSSSEYDQLTQITVYLQYKGEA